MDVDSHTAAEVMQYGMDLVQRQADDGKDERAEVVEDLENGTGRVAGRRLHYAVVVASYKKAAVEAGVGNSHDQKVALNPRAIQLAAARLEPVVVGWVLSKGIPSDVIGMQKVYEHSHL